MCNIVQNTLLIFVCINITIFIIKFINICLLNLFQMDCKRTKNCMNRRFFSKERFILNITACWNHFFFYNNKKSIPLKFERPGVNPCFCWISFQLVFIIRLFFVRCINKRCHLMNIFMTRNNKYIFRAFRLWLFSTIF